MAPKKKKDEEFESMPGDEEGFEDTVEMVSEDVPSEAEASAEEPPADDLTAPEGMNDSVLSSLTVTTADLPQLDGLQPGDDLRFTVDARVKKQNADGSFEVDVVKFVPVEEQATEEPAAPPAGGAPGGLAGLLGGGQAQ